MKNRQSIVLVCITGLFLSFLMGFLLGRNSRGTDILISSVPETTASRILSASESAVVPSTCEAQDLPVLSGTVPDSAASSKGDSRININTATLAQLDSLPGIGPVLAQRIVDYREENGPFTAVGELMYVDGIGSKKLADILDLITAE